jgi:polysaccharide deacetylase family protein (PEP-CTERM system associated)
MPVPPPEPRFLFSVDLEDVRQMIPDGERFRPRVPELTRRFLDWLDTHKSRATFFVVGDVARAYPELVREIHSRGHEVGCHSNRHIPLDRQTPDEFRRDVEAALEALAACGVQHVSGYRAPTCSLTATTRWAHDILAALGFTYSSSVLPARNPLYGWPEFGGRPQRLPSGLLEIPITVASFGPLRCPFAAGVYFRALPFPLVARAFRRALTHDAVTGYFHPYDIDAEQERFMHPGLNGSRLYNWLMYRNRGQVLSRLDRLVAGGVTITTYEDHVSKLADAGV